MPFGRILLGQTGTPVFALATDPKQADWKVGGITVDWTTVTPVPADIILPDGTTIKAGQKYLRYGQILCATGTATVQTLTLTGGPTGGAVIWTVPAFGALNTSYDVAPLAYNATDQDVAAAFGAVPSIGPTNVFVTRSGSGTAGAPYVYSVTFARGLGAVPAVTLKSHTFSGGTTPTGTPALVTAGVASGAYGPYDPAMGDGRQNLVRGYCYVVNELWTQNPTVGFGAPNVDNPGVFDGGIVWRERMIVTSGAHSLAAGPTFTEFEAAFPRIGYVGTGNQ